MAKLLPLLISLGFYVTNVNAIYNLFLAGVSLLIIPNFLRKNIINRLNFLLFTLTISSLLIYRLINNNFLSIFNFTDFLIIFVAIIFACYLSKLTYIKNFLKLNWYFGLIVWMFYFFEALNRNYLNIKLFQPFFQNNIMGDLYESTGGLIYKPLISMLMILPFIILIYSHNTFKKEILFCPRINGSVLKFLILLISIFLFPSRAISAALVISIFLDSLFYFFKSKNFLNVVSFGIPLIVLSSIFILRILSQYFNEILFIDPRVYLWITGGSYMVANPLSFFVGPGYTQVDEIISDNINLSTEFLDLIDNTIKLVPLQTSLSTWFRSDLLNQNLGFESDFVNGLIGFGCLTFILLIGFVFKKILEIIYFNKEKLYKNNKHEIFYFARYMLIIILSTIFEDKGAYIVLWILILTILSINLIDLNESENIAINKNNFTNLSV